MWVMEVLKLNVLMSLLCCREGKLHVLGRKRAGVSLNL